MCSRRVGSPLGKMDRFLLHIPIQKDDDDVDFFTTSDTRIYGGKREDARGRDYAYIVSSFLANFEKLKPSLSFICLSLIARSRGFITLINHATLIALCFFCIFMHLAICFNKQKAPPYFPLIAHKIRHQKSKLEKDPIITTNIERAPIIYPIVERTSHFPRYLNKKKAPNAASNSSIELSSIYTAVLPHFPILPSPFSSLICSRNICLQKASRRYQLTSTTLSSFFCGSQCVSFHKGGGICFNCDCSMMSDYPPFVPVRGAEIINICCSREFRL